MKVKCIDNKNYKWITIGGIYECIDDSSCLYRIKTDEGGYCSYEKGLFEIVKDEEKVFTWDKFLKGKVYVKLNNKEEWDDFYKECDENGIKFYFSGTEYGYTYVEFYKDEDGGFAYRRHEVPEYLCEHEVIEWVIKEKPLNKTDIAYLILDASGSINQQKKDEYRKIYDKLISESKSVRVITHTTVAKFDDIDFKAMDGGTYLSSGLGLATTDIIARGYNKQGKTIKVIQATDGDNWSEDNERTFNMVNNLLENGVDYEYYEVNPAIYSDTMFKKLEKEITVLKGNNKLHIVKSEELIRTRIYEVEHKVGGKLYDFVNSFKDVKIGDCVTCDTSQGFTYGRVKGVEVKYLTQVQINSYKECKKVV